MKKKLIAVVIALGTLTASAQIDNTANNNQDYRKSIDKSQRSNANVRATKMTEQMTQKLLLTEDQKTKILAINLNKAKKIDGILGIKDKSKQELMSYRKTIEQERENEFKSVLTLDQYEKWHHWKDEKKAELKKMRQNKKSKNKEIEVSESEVMDNMEN
jgi:hypothetical protein